MKQQPHISSIVSHNEPIKEPVKEPVKEPPKPKPVEEPVVHTEPPKREKIREILGFRATEANADKIVLEWSEPDDVKEYKIYWDRSNNETRVLQLLTATKTGKPLFNLDHLSSGGIMGSDYLE